VSALDSGQVARRRGAAPHTSMFLRMLVRRPQSCDVAAPPLPCWRWWSLPLLPPPCSISTWICKPSCADEFRKYGANVVVIAKDGQNLPTDTLSTVRSVLGGGGIAVPFALCRSLVPRWSFGCVAGTDFEQVQKLDSTCGQSPTGEGFSRCPGWHSSCRIYSRRTRQAVRLSFRVARSTESSGQLKDWGSRDSPSTCRSSISPTGPQVPYSTIEISLPGSPQESAKSSSRLGQTVPAATSTPSAGQEGETNVLARCDPPSS